MKTVTFECETLTPMFLAGADSLTPELRAPSIKGALRYWWRAMNGHLGLRELKEKEGAIFGDTSCRSKFSIQVEPVAIKTGKKQPTPHRNFEQPCILEGSSFRVTLSMPVETQNWDIQKCRALFELVCWLGDFGKRARRGMGSVEILQCSDPQWEKRPATLENIMALLKELSLGTYYTIDGSKIKNIFTGSMEYYPWIRQIQVGKPNPNLLKKISNTAHDLHGKDRNRYEASLGHASNGRFASPVYVSVAEGSLKPVITTLNTIPDRGDRDIDLGLQEDFKKRILE